MKNTSRVFWAHDVSTVGFLVFLPTLLATGGKEQRNQE
jgi:hypothetical protein